MAGKDDHPESEVNEPDGPITREELYELIWSQPATHVAAKFGVTDVAVAKWCRKLAVPRPGRGYWARTAAGRKVKQIPLPAAKKGAPTAVPRPRYVERATPQAEREEYSPPPGLEKLPGTIVVPETLDHPHPLIRSTRAALRRGGKDEYGVRHPRGDQALIVYVSDAQIDRALRIMDGLVRSLEGAGFEVTCSARRDEYGRATDVRNDVTIDGEKVAFHLVEKRRRTERQPTEKERKEAERWSYLRDRRYFEYGSTGKLSLVVGYPGGYWSRGRISDGKATPLEAKLRQFVELLLWEAVRLKEERREREERERRELEAQRRRAEEERRRQEELRRRRHLERLAIRWKHSQELRAFLAAAEAALVGAGPEVSPDVQVWLRWARSYLEQLDPLEGDGIGERLIGGNRVAEDAEDVRTTLSRVKSELERVAQATQASWPRFGW
ncbi:MAG: hypothetical protein AB2L07_15700 [Thermoanaerobaculaceae bacterium]